MNFIYQFSLCVMALAFTSTHSLKHKLSPRVPIRLSKTCAQTVWASRQHCNPCSASSYSSSHIGHNGSFVSPRFALTMLVMSLLCKASHKNTWHLWGTFILQTHAHDSVDVVVCVSWFGRMTDAMRKIPKGSPFQYKLSRILISWNNSTELIWSSIFRGRYSANVSHLQPSSWLQ